MDDVGTNPIDLGADIVAVVDNSVQAIGYFAKALCQVIDFGIEFTEIGLNPTGLPSDHL